MGASVEIKQGLYTAINGLGYTTYTVTPQLADGGADTDWPHVQIGAVVNSVWDSNPGNTVTGHGFDFTARIYTRGRGGSEKPGLLIQDAIYAALHHQSITITGYRLILLERQSSSTTRLDGSFTGLCEYHALITEN